MKYNETRYYWKCSCGRRGKLICMTRETAWSLGYDHRDLMHKGVMIDCDICDDHYNLSVVEVAPDGTEVVLKG